MEDLLSDVSGKAEVVIVGASAFGAMLLARIQWWKNLKSTPLKMIIAVGAFLAVAITLSILTAPFT